MKKGVYFLSALFFFAGSCKKKDIAPVGCEISVTGIAGKYKLTKLVASANGINTDLTSTIDACELNALYELKIDKTLLYTETGACSNSGTGTWDIIDGRITASAGSIDFADNHIDNNCTSISVTQPIGSASYITVFTRQ
ncbi:MAG: hypothetical protein IPP72_19410 [Chitinophagaceae bacterium]|nr:hypothetical protein [Chitinophagaceae bacterium]